MSLAENYEIVKNKIAAAAKSSGRTAKDIRLIAVTKKVSVEKIREAYTLGQRDFAENYVQEANLKIVGVGESDIRWHLIGHLQTNKIKAVADKFSFIHSVDREKLVSEISLRSNRAQNILLEVNLAGEESKSGVSVEDLPELIERAQEAKNVVLKGFMFMPPLDLALTAQLQYFKKARNLIEKMQKNVSAPHSLLELSMGTSHDFEAAINEGATMVRLGTVLFGERAK